MTLEIVAKVTRSVAFIAHCGVSDPPSALTHSPQDVSFWFASVRKDYPRECGASTSVDNSAAAPATVGG